MKMNEHRTIIGHGCWPAYQKSPEELLSYYGSQDIAGTIVGVFGYYVPIPVSLGITNR